MKRAAVLALLLGGIISCGDGGEGPAAALLIKASGPVIGTNISPPCLLTEMRSIQRDAVSGSYSYFSPLFPDKDSMTLLTERNADVLAAAPGEVFRVERLADGESSLVEIRHGAVLRTLYRPVVDLQVAEGARVREGVRIGTCRNRLEFSIHLRRAAERESDRFRHLLQGDGATWHPVPAALILFGEALP